MRRVDAIFNIDTVDLIVTKVKNNNHVSNRIRKQIKVIYGEALYDAILNDTYPPQFIPNLIHNFKHLHGYAANCLKNFMTIKRHRAIYELVHNKYADINPYSSVADVLKEAEVHYTPESNESGFIITEGNDNE